MVGPTPPQIADASAAHPGLGTPRRWGVFVAGLLCLMVGISMLITADLGVGSWQIFETGLVEATGASFAVVVFAEAAVAITLAWAWLGERPWIATAVLAFGGVGIGAALDVLVTPEHLVARGILLGGGTVLLAVGVAFYLASDLGASAQDALFVGFYKKYAVRPAAVRLGLDVSLGVAGFALGGQLGAGTVVVTLLVPAIIEPALLVGHRLAGTPPPVALRSSI